MNPSQATDIAQHYHTWIAVFFVLGYLVHAGLQVDAIARAKNNPLNTHWDVIKQNGFRLTARFFISLMAFMFFWKNPSTVPAVLGYFGINMTANATAILTLPMSPWVSGIMGFSVDSLLAYVPYLKNSLPPIEGVQAGLLSDAADHIAVAKDEVEQAKAIPSGLDTGKNP